MQACAAGQRDHSAVDHLDRPIPGAACSNRRHDFLIEPGARSSCKPAPHSVPFAEAFRQVAPGRAGPGDPEDPEDAFQDLPVVDRRAASAPTDRRQKRREQPPSRVVDDVSVQGWLPFSSLESCRWGYGNPLCPHGLGRVDKAHPAMDCGDLEEAEEAFGCLVVARRDAAKLLQQTHHALDAISPGIAATVQRARRFAVRLPRDDRARATQI
jgi:hypothetical protein